MKFKKCPKCNSDKIVPIIYGYPAGGLWEKEKRGEVKLEGCLVTPENPKWHCKDCKNEWK